MIRPDEVQSALVQYMKVNTTITASIPDGSDEIRESQWQGVNFKYPNIRVNVPRLTEMTNLCHAFNADFSILVFSEEASSYEADKIVGIINNVLHRRSFSYQNVRFVLTTSTIIPAIRSESRLWRSELLLRGTVN